MSVINWIFGTGTGTLEQLEMFVPNYIERYGFFGCFLLYITIYRDFFKYVFLKKKNNNSKHLYKCFLICSIGGFISGYGDNLGQAFIGIIIAGILLFSNNESTQKVEN